MAKTKSKRVAELEKALNAALTIIVRAADQMVLWADNSRRGSWSTHQWDANLKLAKDLRIAHSNGMVALVGPAGRKLPRPPY